MILPEFHPVIQTVALRIACPELSLAEIGDRFQISKQAVQKRLDRATPFLLTFGTDPPPSPDKIAMQTAEKEIDRLKQLVTQLQLIIVAHGAIIFLLHCLRERIAKFFPNFKLSRLLPLEKWRILEYWRKYERLGGTLKNYCRAIEKSPDTIRGWLMAYERFGMAGLADKTSRPHHFANSIPVWLREQLFLLFTKFPEWTPYQYYKYIKGHPAYHWAISVPTITKLKETQVKRTAEERERLKKLWAFAPGTDVWTVDYTCLYKTDSYKLQLLTVSDHRSRFLFETALFIKTSTASVMDHLEELFIKYGKPFMIKADNGPEFRLDCRADLERLSIYLMNSPTYYGQFCGAHERIHRTLKEYIEAFSSHCNITRLEANIRAFRDDYNHRIPLEPLGMKTPAEIYYSDPDFLPKGAEIVTPYTKEGELRMKFTDRNGDQARVGIPEITR